ncbi:hypothetical protein [uncultured Friedmanniella sp.]|uniref:hypothetical protein n=1 Tax=uncultured Friedmanniella sp. TaxID=335381 RepID=UPI0035CA3A96
MSSPTTDQTPTTPEERLEAVLRTDSERVALTADALTVVQRRIAGGPAAPRAVAGRPRRVVALAGVLALAAAVTVVVGLGLRPTSDPRPVEHPTVAPTYGGQGPRSQVDIFRVRLRSGSPVLSVEAVSTSTPFQPRAALDALFGLAPLSPADNSPLNNGRNVVDSTSETMDALVVDLSAADQTSRPATPALGRAWLQAWVQTTQSAYNSGLPVLIRLQGRPITLYGFDTTKAIAATHLPEVHDIGIEMPRPGQSLTSPVLLAANLPDGQYQWKVVDSRGKTVFSDGLSGSAGLGTFTATLVPGAYRAVVASGPDSGTPRFRREVAFTVAGTAGATVVVPVSDPPTTPLTAVAVYWATTGSRPLVRELRTSRDPAEMLNDYFRLPSTADGIKPTDAGNRVRSVTAANDGIVVDFSRLQPDPADWTVDLPYRQAQAFAATVRSVVGRDLPVRVTRDGRPTSFLTQRTLPGPSAEKQVDAETDAYPQPVHEPGRAEIVGVTRNPAAPTTYVLYDAVTQEPRYQGTIADPDPHTGAYAFAVAVPAGRYLLEINSSDVHDEHYSTLSDLTVG